MLAEKKKQIQENLEILPDRFERLAWITDQGKQSEAFEEDWKLKEFQVEGCMSQVWCVPELKEGKCYFRVDSDSAVVKGVANLICEVYSDETPQDILDNQEDFLEEVGIYQHVSENRRNGLAQIRKLIFRFAESARESTAEPAES